MPTLATTHPTLVDHAKRLDPDGKIAQIAELLSQSTEVLDSMTWIEGNLPTGHRSTVRTGLPAPTWRKLYGGVQPSRSTTAQVTDNTGMLEAYAESDKALADLAGNTAEFRFSEEIAFIEGMSQEMASTLFYGNEGTQPEAFTGLSPRYNDLDSDVPSSANILDAGGTGSANASIWLVVWAPNTVSGIYPKASTAGLKFRDMGEVTIEDVDGAGGRMQAYRSHYRWDAGLMVKDWRFAVRIANIDLAVAAGNAVWGGSGTSVENPAPGAPGNLVEKMIQAAEMVPNLGAGRAAFYMSRPVRTAVRMQSKNARNVQLPLETVAGRRVAVFDEIPVYRVDALAATEGRVVDQSA